MLPAGDCVMLHGLHGSKQHKYRYKYTFNLHTLQEREDFPPGCDGEKEIRKAQQEQKRAMERTRKLFLSITCSAESSTGFIQEKRMSGGPCFMCRIVRDFIELLT